ncbi:hypothetical protein ACVWZ4_000025 [Bradyrhizobium sp. USDA 4472]
MLLNGANPMPNALYFAEVNHRRLGPAFRETDRDLNSRDEIIGLIRSGEIDPLKIIEVVEPCDEYPNGRVADVTDEIVAAAIDPVLVHSFDPTARVEYLNDHRRDLREQVRA